MAPPEFSHKVEHILWIIPKYYEFSRFVASFNHFNDIVLILELQVCDSAPKYWKNILRYTGSYYIREPPRVLIDFDPSL